MSRGWRLALPLVFLIVLHLACVLGEFLAPNSPVEQDRELAWAPPAHLRFFDDRGTFYWRPFVYPLVPDAQSPNGYVEDTSEPYPLEFFVRGDPYRLLGLMRTEVHFLGVSPPAKLLFLGTDASGRDLFAQLLVGGRVSLFAGLLAAGLALSLGTILGGVAGYFDGRADAFLMRAVELFLALPWLYLLLALRAFLPLQLTSIQSFILLVLVIGLIGWAAPARLIRGVVLSTTHRPFVTAARNSGASDTHIIRKHILPHALPVIATQAAILVPSYILAEVTLSFFGLGIADPQPSWGRTLETLGRYHVLSRYWWVAAPALPLLATFLSYYSLGRQPTSMNLTTQHT